MYIYVFSLCFLSLKQSSATKRCPILFPTLNFSIKGLISLQEAIFVLFIRSQLAMLFSFLNHTDFFIHFENFSYHSVIINNYCLSVIYNQTSGQLSFASWNFHKAKFQYWMQLFDLHSCSCKLNFFLKSSTVSPFVGSTIMTLELFLPMYPLKEFASLHRLRLKPCIWCIMSSQFSKVSQSKITSCWL